MENVRKKTELVTTNKRRNYLVSKPSYHTAKCLSGNLLAIEMKKVKVKVNYNLQIQFTILLISKTLMHEFWYDYINP